MKNKILIAAIISVIFILTSCSKKEIKFDRRNLDLVNREIIVNNEKMANKLKLNAKQGDGMAVLKNINFEVGTIEIELKGENNPGKSFVGIAFNIQNDSTYEAIYFRPFNFQSDKQISREHSIQYISQPKNTWHFLRANHEGKYEAEYPRKPSPKDWFKIKVKIENDKVYIYDIKSNTKLLSIERLEKPVSNKIGLWTGNNSKGEFKNLRIQK